MSETVLKVNDVTRHYRRHKKKGEEGDSRFIKSVDGVSFALNAGEVLGIIGESGCGKSTLGRLLVRLEPPTSGSVEVGGQNAEQLIKKDRLGFRRTMQMVFQNPFDTFDPRHNLEKIMVGALKLHSIGQNDGERRQMVLRELESAGLTPAESFLGRFPHEMSGGQLQRISILRSMMLKPKVVVADEPVSMLDVSIRADIINMLSDTARKAGTALVFISHDISTTRYISDHILVMYLGRVVEYGKSDDVAAAPMHPYTQALISNCQSVDPRKKSVPIRLKGEPPTPANVPSGCPFHPRCPRATPECAKTAQTLRQMPDGRLVSCMMVEANKM